MPIDNSDFDPRLLGVLTAETGVVGDGLWFDAHTHIGFNDPDGRAASTQEILGGLDAAGHHRALVFAMHEPDGYAPANDRVLEAAASSNGRLLALARISPHHDDAVAEARRCLRAGARGFKLHPRSDAFALPHPAVERVVAMAAEQRMPVLFHAGRGIPHLGEAVVDLAGRYPDARLILAHAGISDLSWIAARAQELPNLFFDTSWWMVADLLALFTTVPPARILYASDMPYGPGVIAAFLFLRVSGAVGLGEIARREIAGGQLARVVAGEAARELGPAPTRDRVGARMIETERVMVYAATAIHFAFHGVDPTEPLALARLACRTSSGAPLADMLAFLDRMLAIAVEALAQRPTIPTAIVPAALVAVTVAGTPHAGIPAVVI